MHLIRIKIIEAFSHGKVPKEYKPTVPSYRAALFSYPSPTNCFQSFVCLPYPKILLTVFTSTKTQSSNRLECQPESTVLSCLMLNATRLLLLCINYTAHESGLSISFPRAIENDSYLSFCDAKSVDM